MTIGAAELEPREGKGRARGDLCPRHGGSSAHSGDADGYCPWHRGVGLSRGNAYDDDSDARASPIRSAEQSGGLFDVAPYELATLPRLRCE